MLARAGLLQPCVPQEASNLAEAHGAWRALAAGSQPGAADANGAANGAGAGPPLGSAADPGSALERLLATPTPARVLLSRVPPDAEAQLYFMLTQARPEGRGRVGGCDVPRPAASARGDAGGPAAGMPGCLSSLCRRRVVLCERAPRGG